MRVEHATPGGPSGVEENGPPDAATGSEDGPEVMEGPGTVRVVVVDDRGERRRVMCQLLEHSFTRAEIAEADSREAAIEVVGRCHPPLVLLEIQMPLVDEGLHTIAALHLMSPRPRIVVCSFHRDATTIQDAVDRGADVYVRKPTSAIELRSALGPLPAAPMLQPRMGALAPPDLATH